MAFGSEAWDFARQRDNDRMEQLAFAGLQTKLAKERAEKARYESEAANPQTMASFFAQLSGGGQGGVPQDNRFAAGLSDAESRLRALLDNPDSVQQSAAYKFRVNQGQEALQRSLGAKGLLNSGNRLMELTKYGQDMGSQEYDAQAGRLSSLLGNYSQGWNANNAANVSAQASRDSNRLGFAKLAWDMQNDSGRVIGRSSGGMTVPAGTLGGMGGNIGMGPTGFGSLATADDPYNSGFGIRDRFGKVSGRSEITPQPGTLEYNDYAAAQNKRQTY